MLKKTTFYPLGNEKEKRISLLELLLSAAQDVPGHSVDDVEIVGQDETENNVLDCAGEVKLVKSVP